MECSKPQGERLTVCTTTTATTYYYYYRRTPRAGPLRGFGSNLNLGQNFLVHLRPEIDSFEKHKMA